MTEPGLFLLAQDALGRVIGKITDDQWGLISPEGLARQPATLREIINCHSFDDAWVPDVLAGKTAAEVGETYAGDLLSDDPKGNYRKYADRASAAVRDFTDLDKPVHLSYGEWSARDYLQHITSFRGFRAWDLARWLGQDPTLPDELVQGMWELLEPHMDDWRQLGVYGPAVEVPESADLQTRLLARAGRKT